jgi:hypothetical protein
MKTRLTLVSVCILLILVVTYTAFAQGKKNGNNGNKEQHNNGNGKDKKNKGEKENGKHDKEGKEDKEDKDEYRGNKVHEGKDDDNGNKHKTASVGFYHWNHENFRDRDKMRKQEKVTICHKIGNNEPGVALTVSRNALQAHLAHGDAMGDCPNVSNTRFSRTYIDRRNEYYNTLQASQEQVVYSKSIYEYALERLTNSQSQLRLLQNNNAPADQVQAKQAMVTELGQNVSLLETLIGVAVNLLANKLQ